MKFTRIFDFLLNVVTPLLLGIFIYANCENQDLPIVIKNHFPDLLWAYSFLSIILIIWERNFQKSWILSAFILAVAYEILQHLEKLPGTGDLLDIIAYAAGFFLAIKYNLFFKTNLTCLQHT